MVEGDAQGFPEGWEWISVALMIFAVMLLGYVAYYGFQYGFPDLFGDDEPPAGERLEFTVDQVEEFNRVYDRRRLEWSWCMDVDGERVSEIRHPKESETTEGSVTFECGEKYSDLGDGSVHTHPSGSAYLSHTDKRSSLQFTCLVHGFIREEPSEDVRSLKCIEHLGGEGSLEFREVNIAVVAG